MAHENENARLDSLRQLNLLDTPPSESFDRIARMASQIFGLPIAAISLTDQDRQWFKSRVGVEHMSIPRDRAPCAQVAATTQPVLIPDLLADQYYATSVLAGQGIRFYAGAPLTTRDGYGLGALCVLGTEPRTVVPAEMAALKDLAQMVMSQIELQHAFGRIDPLTGLPNRTQFLDDLDDLARDHPDRRRLAVIVQVARNEQINNGTRVMGSAYIEDLLQNAARILRGVLGPDRQAYHLAPAQFGFLAPPEMEEDAYLELLGAVRHKLHAQSETSFITNIAIGIAPFVTGRMSSRTVLRMAHSAMLDARTASTGTSVYSSAEDCTHRRRFRLLNDFGAALADSRQLRLIFQPRVDLHTRRCIGAEALLRWSHPELGEISPAEFIPIIEQTLLARQTTAKVLDMGLKQLGSWCARGRDIQLSINVSAANLNEDDFAQNVQLYLLKHRVPAGMLELEVTESAIMGNTDQAIAQLKAIEAAGIRIAIDDFGTGYSSLSYLQRLPAQVVKIDQSFVRDLTLGDREQTLVRSMISLSHDLGFRVVAEGVETAASAAMLAEMACEEAQGFFFGHPMEVDDFDQWFDGQALEQAAA